MSMDAYVMAERTTLGVYDQASFQPKQQWTIPEKTQEPEIEILYMQVSDDQEKIGIILGRQLIKNEQEITHLAIYKKDRN